MKFFCLAMHTTDIINAMKQQVLIIRGGETYKSKVQYIEHLRNKKIDLAKFRFKLGWKENLQSDLGANFDVLSPKMPNITNAQYSEWKIWFEKIIESMDKNIILIGNSLGGMFITKYLSENKTDKNILATILVATPHESTSVNDTASFSHKKSLNMFDRQSKKIYIIHSDDDPIVPISQAYTHKQLLPKAELIIKPTGGHFNDTEHFPEIVEIINKL